MHHRITPAVLLLLLLLLLLGRAAAQTPVVRSVFPSAGPFTESTLVFISGENLGTAASDLVDIVVAGASCRNRSGWVSAKQLFCVVPVPSPLPATLPAPPSGPVIVTTASGGASNADVLYTFQSSCVVHAAADECDQFAPLCAWCKHSAQCREASAFCDQGCAGGFVYLTCSELTGIVFMSVVLAALIAGLIWFGVKRTRILRKKLGTSDSHDGLHDPHPVPAPDAPHGRAASNRDRRSVVSTYGGGVNDGRLRLVDESDEDAEDDDAEADEDDFLEPDMSASYQRKQAAIEQRYRMLQQQNARSSLTSFF